MIPIHKSEWEEILVFQCIHILHNLLLSPNSKQGIGSKIL